MKLFVRVSPAVKTETRRRCGMAFTREWQEVEVDEATASRLCADQMLDCAEVLDEADLEGVDPSENPGMTFDEALAAAAGTENPGAGGEAPADTAGAGNAEAAPPAEAKPKAKAKR